jgi:CheY-like chemotaxis protein
METFAAPRRKEHPTTVVGSRRLVGRLMVIDDDELSREVVALVAAEAGFESEGFQSGEEAIAHLAAMAAQTMPSAILTDMQMPGISGGKLARRLRGACGAGTVLVAMSGSAVAKREIARFDGFLLKPFSAKELGAACHRMGGKANEMQNDRLAETGDGPVILSETVYENFARSMPAGQLASLYKMCLDDVHKRLETMRRASAESDDAGYRRSAHAVKGGCGMVGAMELASLAAEMERVGLTPSSHDGPKQAPLDQFLAASVRLESMLDAKAHKLSS